MENNETEWEGGGVDQRVRMLCRALPDRKMDQTKLKKLLETANAQDQIKLNILHNAVVKCIRDYQADSVSAKLKDWKSAEGALDAFIDTLWAEHLDEGPTLPNLLAVVDYLNGKGWKVKKSSAYQHHKDGKIRPQNNGAYRITDVEKYAATFLKRLDGGKEGTSDAYQNAKQAAETRKMEAQARHWDMKAGILEGLYVEKDLFERELARRASVFRNDIDNFIRSQAAGIINMVAGDAAKIPDLIGFMLDQAENWIDRYAEDKEFRIPLPPAMEKNDDNELMDDDTNDDGEE
jgi:hypothetical protein